MDKNSLKEWIESKNPKGLSKKYIHKNRPELDTYLENSYPPDLLYKEKIYWFMNDITSHPVCKCGRNTHFRSMIYGYNKHCSQECSSADPARYEKIKQTRKEKYGDEHYNNREKATKTYLEKYGVENPFQSEDIKSKIKQVYQTKYGVDYPSQSPQIQDVRKINALKKYGVDHHSKLKNIQEKIINSNRINYLSKDSGLIGYDENGLQIRKCPHPECDKCAQKQYIISAHHKKSRDEWNIEPCTNILPIQHSRNKGTEIEKFICDVLDEYNIEYQTNVRGVISPQELDIYIPSKKIAVECNGIFWHSQNNGKNNHYHVQKWNMCNSKNIQLLTLWEDQIKNKPNIIKSLILSKLGVYNERIYAEACEVVVLDNVNEFLNQNHIQGKTNAAIKLGLKYKDKIVSVMTFVKRSKLSGGQKDNSWELTRLCSLLNTQVIGGARKLLKYFIEQYNPPKIISFASNDISNGNVYEKLGFYKGVITNMCWYISKKDMTRYHHASFSKKRLGLMGFNVQNKTEKEVMSSLPFYRIYDSGRTKYILDL